MSFWSLSCFNSSRAVKLSPFGCNISLCFTFLFEMFIILATGWTIFFISVQGLLFLIDTRIYWKGSWSFCFWPLDQMYYFATVLFIVVYENFSLVFIVGNIFSSIIFSVNTWCSAKYEIKTSIRNLGSDCHRSHHLSFCFCSFIQNVFPRCLLKR